MMLKGEKFHLIVSVATDVPVLICGEIRKQFLVPGWCLSWILIHDQIDTSPSIKRCLLCVNVVAAINATTLNFKLFFKC